MLYKSTFLAVAPMVMMARAGVEFDLDDTPRICRDVCRPLAELYRGCEVDLRGDNNDREEDQLEVQCFCTNESFNVASVASQCQNCLRQYREDRGHTDGNGNGGNRDDDRDDDRDDNRDDVDDNRDDRDDDRDDNRDDQNDDWDDNRDDQNDQNDDWDDNNDDNRTDDIDDDMDDDRSGGRRNGKRQDDDDRDDDAWQDINDIVRTCGFTSTSIAFSSATAVPSSVSVTATRPTDVDQLTTTFTAASAAETGGNNNNNNGGGNSNSNNDNNDDNNDDGENAAGMLAPLGAAGAFVAGAMALLA